MPAHIFIQGEKFTNTGNIVQWIASRTGWPVVTDGDLIRQAGERSGMGVDKIERALIRRSQAMKRPRHQRKKVAAHLKSALAETLRSEAGIICGVAGHLIPPQMPHVLRVLVTAGTDDRIRRATSDRQIPEREARRQIKKTDSQSFQRHCHFVGSDGPRSASYDVVVPSDVLDTEAAAHMILDHLSEKANAAADDVAKALDDFALTANVQLAMSEKGYDITAAAENGNVRLTVERKVLRLGKMSERIKRMVGAMPDVEAVEVAVGRDFHRTDIVRRIRFEMSSAMQFEGYAEHRRQLRRSAIGDLPANIKQRPEPTIGIGRPLSL